MIRLTRSFALLASLAAPLCISTAQATGIDWGSVPGKDIVLFYPILFIA